MLDQQYDHNWHYFALFAVNNKKADSLPETAFSIKQVLIRWCCFEASLLYSTIILRLGIVLGIIQLVVKLKHSHSHISRTSAPDCILTLSLPTNNNPPTRRKKVGCHKNWLTPVSFSIVSFALLLFNFLIFLLFSVCFYFFYHSFYFPISIPLVCQSSTRAHAKLYTLDPIFHSADTTHEAFSFTLISRAAQCCSFVLVQLLIRHSVTVPLLLTSSGPMLVKKARLSCQLIRSLLTDAKRAFPVSLLSIILISIDQQVAVKFFRKMCSNGVSWSVVKLLTQLFFCCCLSVVLSANGR